MKKEKKVYFIKVDVAGLKDFSFDWELLDTSNELAEGESFYFMWSFSPNFISMRIFTS